MLYCTLSNLNASTACEAHMAFCYKIISHLCLTSPCSSPSNHAVLILFNLAISFQISVFFFNLWHVKDRLLTLESSCDNE